MPRADDARAEVQRLGGILRSVERLTPASKGWLLSKLEALARSEGWPRPAPRAPAAPGGGPRADR